MKFMKLGSKPDSFQTDGDDVRFVATDLATDVIVIIGGIKFYLHKFPLLSKSALLQRLVVATTDDCHDEIHIPDIPGGPAAFEICAKFCYGMMVTLNAYNVVAARCAAEYLEMHETLEKGNLIYKIDVFINSSLFHSWKDSIIVLQTTKSLLPWSEDLKLINHCLDSIACKASIVATRVDWSYTYNRKKLPSENGAEWNGVRKQQVVPKDWWVEDLCELELDFYKRVLTAIKSKGRMSAEVMGEALKAYTYRRVPGFGRGTMSQGGDIIKYRSVVETVIRLLPTEVGSVSCSFLLKLLRAASTLDCSDLSKREVVKRIGSQLHEASVSDLLIPNSPGEVTVYDVDLVLNILEEFVMQDRASSNSKSQNTDEVEETKRPTNLSSTSKISVAKLVDGYLAEIARDPNLPLLKFFDIAEMVSSSSRPSHDGLYRAIDMYLKEHPGLTKSEKKKICNLMDCKKLTADACAHAVQNERLPLRVVVQVLFFEQTRASAASGQGTTLPASVSHGSSTSATTTKTEDDWDSNGLKSVKSGRIVGGSERSSGSNDVKNKTEVKVKGGGGVLMPKNILNKLWSMKGQSGENNSSDTSDSPNSANLEESKSTPSRNIRHSVS